MLIVKTKLAPSSIHGIGVFADQFIPKGELVQDFVEGFDQIFKPYMLEKLHPVAKMHVLIHACKNRVSGDYILCGDNARFFNHSDQANLKSDPGEENDVATRDILPGEELTCNYKEIEADFDLKMSFSSYSL